MTLVARLSRLLSPVVCLVLLLVGLQPLPAAAAEPVAPAATDSPCSTDEGTLLTGDFAFVIDESGSMDWNDPSRLRATASQAFVERFQPGDRAAIIGFSDRARVLAPMTGDLPTLRAALGRIGITGGTNLTPGVQTGLDQLAGPTAQERRFLILLTDGEGPYSASLTARALAEGVVIYTVGLGQGIETSLLTRIAETTGGRFLQAAKASDLLAVFEEIAEETQSPCPAPVPEAGGPYEAPEGGAVLLTGGADAGVDPRPVAYSWDLDGDGAFETPGSTTTLSVATVDGPAERVVSLRTCNEDGQCAEDTATVTVVNVAPDVDAGPDRTVRVGQEALVEGVLVDPAGTRDAPFAARWLVDGSEVAAGGTEGASVSHRIPTTSAGRRAVTLEVTDDDGATGRDTVGVQVLPVGPTCTGAGPSIASLWPPNHAMHAVRVVGVTHPDRAPVTVRITAIRQDEPVDARGDGSTGPDASGVGTTTAHLRAERSGTGDGRVYHVFYEASTADGGVCTGAVTVGVPHNGGKKGVAVDGGPLHDSTVAVDAPAGTPYSLPQRYTVAAGTTLEVPAPGILAGAVAGPGAALTAELAAAPAGLDVTVSPDGAFRVVAPAAFGPTTFTAVIRSGSLVSQPVEIALDVLPGTPALHAPDRTLVVAEDTPAPITLTARGAAAGSVLEVVTPPVRGAAHVDGDVLTYSPAPDRTGADGLRYRVTQPDGTWAEGLVVITVLASNDAPRVSPVAVTTAEDEALDIDVLSSATDPEADALSLEIAGAPLLGTAEVVDGRLRYTPNADTSGTDRIRWRAVDEHGAGAAAWAEVVVTEANDAPVTAPVTVRTFWDAPVAIGHDEILAAASAGPQDEAHQVLTIGLVRTPHELHGTLVAGDGALVYTPDGVFSGTTSFEVEVCDDGTTAGAPDPRCASVTVEVDVERRNRAPHAADSVVTVDEDGEVEITLRGVDPDGDALTYAVGRAPAAGTLTGTGARLAYRPHADAVGTDSFTFTVRDGALTSPPATVVVRVHEVNDAPVPVRDLVTTAQLAPVEVPLADLLANDVPGPADEAGQTLTVTAAALADPTDGTVTLDGVVLRYVPADGALGRTVTVTYTVCDDGTTRGTADPRCADGELLVDVARPGLPLPADDALTVAEDDASTAVDVLANDTHEDGLALELVSVDGARLGEAVVRDGAVHYTPLADQHGTDRLSYTVRDERGAEASAWIDVVVTEVNDAPVPGAPAASTTWVDALRIPVADLLADARPGPDAEAGQALTVTAVETDGPGTVALADGVVTFTPDGVTSGPATFRFQVCDDGTTAGAPDARCAWGTVTVDVTEVNRRPLAHDATVTTVRGVPVSATLGATDPDGDALTFTVVDRPAGATVTVDGAVLTVVPEPGFVGTLAVPFTASDGSLTSEAATLTVTVEDVVVASLEVVPAVVELAVGDEQPLTVRWTDQTGAVRTDAAGVTWAVADRAVATVGADGVVRGVGDGSTTLTARLGGRTATATVTVTDVAAVGLVVDPGALVLLVGGTAELRAIAVREDGTGRDVTGTVTWETTGTDVARVADGIVTGTGAGTATVVARLGALEASASVTVAAPVADDGGQPTATITAPVHGDVVTGPVTVTGTASDPNLLVWELQTAPRDSTAFVTLAHGTTPVVEGALGTFDATSVLNGQHTVRLRVTDRGGRVRVAEVVVDVDGGQKVGPFTLSFLDLDVPVMGIPLSVTRTYDSRDLTVGDFGVGWSMGVTSMDLDVDGVHGEGWSVSRSGGILPTYSITPARRHRVSVTLPDGRVERFEMGVTPTSSQVVPLRFLQPTYTRVPGTLGSLEVLDGATLWLTGSQPGAVTLVDDTELEPFDPGLFRYTSPEGTRVVIHADSGVRSITDANGNEVTITADGIEHSSGASVQLERDAAGRVVALTDPAGGVQRYAYDAAGDLVSHTDAAGATTRMRYDWQHNLVELVDPLGNRSVRNEYDDRGRLVATTDAAGHRTVLEHDTENRRRVVTDRLGRVTVQEYDARGDVVRETLPDGTTVERTFDAAGNQLTATDALGGTVTRAFDAGNRLLEQVDAAGNVLRWTYDAQGRMATQTDAEGAVTTYAYDTAGNVLTETTPLGTTTHTYDASGLRLTTTTPDGAVHRYAYDASGNRVRTELPDGAVETSTFDANGKELTRTLHRTAADGTVEALTTTYRYDARGLLVEQTDPAGRTTRTEHDAAGRVVATVDPAGGRTTTERDARGDVVRTTYPDGTTELVTYDAMGKRLSTTDRGGRTTTYEYDRGDRLVAVGHPDGTWSRSEYDAAGNLVARADPGGGRTEYGVDAAGRRVSQTDPSGAVTHLVLDGRGDVVREVDPEGRATEHRYDAAGNRVLTTFADGSTSSADFDAASNLVASTDQGGRTTTFARDGLGRLTGVTDPLGATTTYEYDEAGNKVAQTDANGHVTRFVHDAVDRLVSTVRPSGAADRVEYDLLDRVVARTGFGGGRTTSAYDAAGRLVETVDAAGAVVTRTYTASGAPATVTDARGTTRYAYDVRDRLVEVEHPDGRTVTYGYDAAGRRTSMTTPQGTVTYEYDTAGRLAEVADPTGAASYEYDLAGTLTQVEHANGVRTAYEHDALRRVTGLTVQDAGGAVLFSQGLTLAPGGEPLSVVETGREVAYAYDGAGRLVDETVTDAQGTLARGFTYDAVGNRLTEQVSGPAGSTSTTHTYDADDRLLTSGPVTSEFDGDGNPVRTVGPDGTVERSYDGSGRLVGVTDGTARSAYEYDADGVLVATEVDGVRTDLLVDTARELSQVVAEYGEDGELTASYLYGEGLVASSRDGVTVQHHADAIGSTRVLTDAQGVVTDTYAFEAFGALAQRTGATENPYLFTGERFDEGAGAYQLRARWYEPTTGRFLTTDPFAGVEEMPVSLHRYQYANANPLVYTDPTGEMSMMSVSVSMPVHGTLTGIRTINTAAIMARVMVGVRAASIAVVATCSASLALSTVTAAGLRPCDVTNANIFYSGADTPETTAHIADAISIGHPAKLTRRSPAHSRSWLSSSPACKGNVAATSGLWCDEYPFASTDQGGKANQPSLKLVPAWEQMYQGGRLSAFYAACAIPANDPVKSLFAVVASYAVPVTSHVCA